MEEEQQWIVAAQVSGSLVGAFFRKQGGWRQMGINIFTGLSCTTFCGPAVIAYVNHLGVLDPRLERALYYLIGMVGSILTLAIFHWVETHNVLGFFFRRLFGEATSRSAVLEESPDDRTHLPQ